MDDHQRYWDFWFSINRGYDNMNYKWEFEKYWGKGSYPPEKIILTQTDFDTLVERLNEQPQYDEKIARVLQRKPPWNE